MAQFFRRLGQYFQLDKGVPAPLRENFYHYYWDIMWWGLLNGSTLSFLNYFAVRMGATSTQVGLITAIPALVSLVFALPAGVMLARYSTNRATFVASVLARALYPVFILLPFIKSSSFVIWAIIATTFVMTFPAIFSTVAFNVAFAENIPDEYRAHVAGIRNAAFAVVTIGVSLLSGAILTSIKFPHGYVVVFAIGFLGSVFSAYHLSRLKTIPEFSGYKQPIPVPTGPKEGWIFSRLGESFQVFKKRIRLDMLKGRTGLLIALLALLNFSLSISGPVYPIYLVNQFHFSDQAISIGMASFYFAIFVGSLFLEKFEILLGRQKVTGLGLLLMAIFPVILIFMKGPLVYYGANLISGFGWALTGGEVYNYLFERIPAQDHTSGIAWYNMTTNAALLAGSLLGPLISNLSGFVITMLVFAILRFVVSLAILRWG